MLAKWLEVSPQILLLDDPTRGVDVGGKSEIYELIVKLAGTGVTVLFTSTEFSEYQAVCHRVIVFQAGQVKAELAAATATEHVLTEAVNTGSRSRPPAHVTSADPSGSAPAIDLQEPSYEIA